MKILVAHPLSPELLGSGLGEMIVYHPELAEQSEDALREHLLREPPDGLLVDGHTLDPATLTAWREAATRPTVHLVHRVSEGSPAHREAYPEIQGLAVARETGRCGELRSDVDALGIAERSLVRTRAAAELAVCGISPGTSSSCLNGARVSLVGAGIVNLITACELVEHGASLDVLDAGPDPRGKPDWRLLGATHGGENARMFCFTEADNYNEKTSVVYSGMDEVFRRPIREGGWLAVAPDALDAAERAWIRDFDCLPCWRAEVFSSDIHGFNMASGELWGALREAFPHLFREVGLVEDVLRIYTQPRKVTAAQALHGRLGSMLRPLDGEDLAHRHPALAEAVASGAIAGGLEIRGFTLNIHEFVAKLLAHLEARGVRFQWSCRVDALERDTEGCIAGLHTANGTVRAEHYVVSPGIYGNSLLRGTRSDGKIQGILGLWMLLPNVEPRLRHSLKIHREGHVGEDSNVTLAKDAAGRPILILGSGYGFLGNHPLDMETPEIACLFEALEETARRFFPAAYRRALDDGTLYGARKACVRPFTSTGLGIFEVNRTAAGGRLVITSGHNTGGFTQAPSVAEAVVATLGGASHPMQALYEPERGIHV